MTQAYIRQLAGKFLDGTASEEEKEILHKWYDSQNPDVPDTETVFARDPESANAMKARMLSNLKAMQQPARKRADFTMIKRFASWSTAVAAMVIVGFIFWTNQRKPSHTAIKTVQAPLGKTFKVTLPDGSSIWLNAGSTVTYPTAFSGKTREVVLKEGQAFFDVIHMTDKPFVVHAKAVNITVLGTSFDVKAYHNDPDIKVTVKTGKVGVTMRDKPDHPATMLLPAEQAVVPEKSAEIHVTEISKPAIASWKDNRMVFEDALLSEVFRVLERKYKQHIKIEKTDLSAEKITLTLDDQPIGDVLKVLSFSKKFNYSQLNDSTIVIK